MRLSLRAATLAVFFFPCPAGAADKRDVEQAVAAGVNALRRLQSRDGRWLHHTPDATVGSTALAGLTLLVCGADKEDRAVTAAADFVRGRAPSLGYTYSIALTIVFLDLLGDPGDVPLLESLAARLVAGQHASGGGWSYYCPVPAAPEQQRLTELVAQRRLERGDRPQAGVPRRLTRDEIQERIGSINSTTPPAGNGLGRPDNSITQFATLALWVSRRHGFSVDGALRATERHFRASQGADGGWPYYDLPGAASLSTPTMTCAGLLGLAVGIGVGNDKSKGKGTATRDPSKDPLLRNAVTFLSRSIGVPPEKLAGLDSGGEGGPAPPRAGEGGSGDGGNREPRRGGGRMRDSSASGRLYYYLWSLERVAVALNLDTIGDKDWYSWGSEILLSNQEIDGTWRGDYPMGGVDTCFALLFLKRANLTMDLTALTHTPLGGRAMLKAGEGGEAKTAPPKDERAGRPKFAILGDTPAARLANALLALPAHKQEQEIDRLGAQKGSHNTEALALAVPFLPPEMRQKARQALAEREGRMKAETVGRDLGDDNPEIRRAAVLACAYKEARQFIPQLIDLLNDPNTVVVRAAHAALKDMTGRDLGPAAGADAADRKRAADAWRNWWQKQPH
jgi:hypothetical protein